MECLSFLCTVKYDIRDNSFNLIGTCSNQIMYVLSFMLDQEPFVVVLFISLKACPQCYKSMSGLVSSDVVEWEQKDRDIYQRTEKFSVHLHKSDNLSIPDSEEIMNITLKPSSSEMVSRVLDYE
uniref:Uncharacterized protein n=1 Tax=Salix viminalis TaxID=40686 RepID=A0A6N2MYX5_SALVM